MAADGFDSLFLALPIKKKKVKIILNSDRLFLIFSSSFCGWMGEDQNVMLPCHLQVCSTGECEVGMRTLSDIHGGVQLRVEEQNPTLPVPPLYLTMLSVSVASVASVPMLILGGI